MKMRLLNRCPQCGRKWFPRGFDLSGKCPNCESGDTETSGAFYLVFLVVIAIGAGIFWATGRTDKIKGTAAATPASSATPTKLRRPRSPTPALTIVPALITTEAEGRREAVRLYPDLAVADSPMNREFVIRYRSYQRLQPDFFHDPAWPVTLAKECAAVIGGQSNAQ